VNAKQAYFGMIGLIVVLVLALLFGARSAVGLLKTRSSKMVGLQLQQQVLQDQQDSLARDKLEIKKYAQLEKISKAIVPQDKDQAATTREIVKIASESGITLSQINFAQSSLDGTSPITSKKVQLSQLTPVKGMTGLYELPITITQDSKSPVSYNQFIGFLQHIEQNRRTAQVTSISLQPDSKNPGLLSFSLTINEYIKP
jgi:hypothetical protein